MSATIPDEGKLEQLTALMNYWATSPYFLVGLLKTAPTLGPTMTYVTDIAPLISDFTGSTPLNITEVPTDAIDTCDMAEGDYMSFTWVAGDATNLPQDAVGWYVVNGATAKALACALFASPITISAAGDGVTLDLKAYLGEGTACVPE